MSIEGCRYTGGIGLAGEDRVIATVKKLKLAGSVDASDLSEAVKEYRIPFSSDVDGVKVPVSLVQLVDGTKRPIPLVSTSAPWGNGVPTWVRDATLNDSDKSFTVPVGKIWKMNGIYYLLAASATVGNRVPKISIAPDGTNYLAWFTGLAVAASATATGMMTFDGITDDFVNMFTISQGVMPVILNAGSVIRVWDNAAIDPAADDLTVVLHYVEYDV